MLQQQQQHHLRISCDIKRIIFNVEADCINQNKMNNFGGYSFQNNDGDENDSLKITDRRDLFLIKRMN